MSTLRCNAIQDTSGVERYLARAWVNFNGTGTVAIRASGNVSSITDNGVGDYTVNFTNALPDANYAIVGMLANTGDNYVNEFAGASRGASCMHQNGNPGCQPTTTSVRVNTRFGSSASPASNGANADFTANYVAIFR